MKASILGSTFFALLWLSTASFAETPTEQLQQTIYQVIEVVGNKANGHDQRKEVLRETLMPRFDWLEMAKQTLGKHWHSASGREREVVSAFAEFLGHAYIGQITSYRDEKVQFVQESIQKNRAHVKTRIVSDKGDPVSIDYRLHRVGDEWKIYDVVIEDISIVMNYRSQFDRVLAKGNLDDLLRQMKKNK